MKALGGPFDQRARAVFAAGVDIALHCNGVLAEAGPVAGASPELSGVALRRAEAALARIAGGPQPFDVEAARREFADLFASEEAAWGLNPRAASN